MKSNCPGICACLSPSPRVCTVTHLCLCICPMLTPCWLFFKALVPAPRHFGFLEALICYGPDSGPQPLSNVRVEPCCVILVLSVQILKRKYFIGSQSVSRLILPGPFVHSWPNQQWLVEILWRFILQGRSSRRFKQEREIEYT